MKKYSILTFIMNNYENVREPFEISENAEYILVTDNPKLKSKTWTIKLIPNWLKYADGFTKSFYVRYHPFEFVNTDTCIVVDGSIHVKKSLDKLIYDFENSGKDCLLMLHCFYDNIYEEYNYWKTRGYSSLQALKSYAFFKAIGYSQDYKGAFEAGFKIVKNYNIIHELHDFVYAALEKVGTDKLHIERVDQGILTAIINTNFTKLKIMPASHQIIQNDYMMYCCHHTNKPNPVKIKKDLYLFNKKTDAYQLI